MRRNVLRKQGMEIAGRIGVLMVLLCGLSLHARGQSATAPASAASGANLLRNGGFEEGNLGPDGWRKGDAVPGVEYLWTTGVAFEGKACLCLRKTEQRFWPLAEWMQEFAYTGSAPALSVNAMAKAQDLTKAVIDAQFFGGDGVALGHKWAVYLGAKDAGAAPLNQDWKSCAGTVAIPQGTKTIRVAFQIYGPGVVAFDNVSATYAATAPAGDKAEAPAAAAAPSPAAANAPAEAGVIPLSLVNPGFEDGTGDPAGWSRGAAIPGVEYVWEKGTAHSGKGCLGLRKTAKSYFPIAQWSQSVSKERPARALRVSAWAKCESATKAILDAQFTNSAGNESHKWVVYLGSKGDNDPPANHDWKAIGGEVPIPPDTATISIAFQIYGPGTVWFDDVQAALVE